MQSLLWNQATRENFPAHRANPFQQSAWTRKHGARIRLTAFSLFNISIAFLLAPHATSRRSLVAAILTAFIVVVGIHLPRKAGTVGNSHLTPSPTLHTVKDFERFPFEKLLGREEVRTDRVATRELVQGKTVCVTGAGGSIGTALCKEIAAAGPRALLLLDKSENSLFYSHRACVQLLEASHLAPHLIDVLDCARVFEIFDKHRPEIVFHTAAYKHVGILETCPERAIQNNVLGTRSVALAAIACQADKFVNVSTDKAVEPTSYMGLSKKLAEAFIRELAASNRASRTCLSNVRFGNVAGSTGSVMRLFLDQIHANGPVYVTDPRASRYFMSVAEAVHLIIHAAMLGKRGETFVFDMGSPQSIHEIAKSMIAMSDLAACQEIEIQFTGLAPAEKLQESLWEGCEEPQATEFQRIFAIPAKNSRVMGILSQIEAIERHIQKNDVRSLLACVHNLVPDFVHRRQPAVAPHAEQQIAEVA